MTHFPLGPLAVEFYDNGRKMVTLRPFAFVDEAYGINVEIPALFTTDLNSSPRMAWWFFAKHDFPEAGVVHDWIFRYPPAGWTRYNCDWVHWRILTLTGCPKWKAEVIFQLLSAGSASAWNRYRQLEATRAA